MLLKGRHTMKRHNLPHLEAKLRDLKELSAQFSDDADFIEMLKIIHRPGWTTPAEFISLCRRPWSRF
jgi:hypothetical protein